MHCIEGFIAREDELRRGTASLPGARVVPLLLGFGFLPSSSLIDENDQVPFEHLVKLTVPLARWAEEQSRRFPLAYVETDYFGGTGGQAAMVWARGCRVFGPVSTSNFRDDERVADPLLEGAINQAMRHLGVKRGAARDEFEALGLGRHRCNESWLSNDS
jgi:hypothetical protein